MTNCKAITVQHELSHMIGAKENAAQPSVRYRLAFGDNDGALPSTMPHARVVKKIES